MANPSLNYVFSVAISALVIRSDYIELSDKKRDLCRAMAIGFGKSASDGDNLFTNKVENVNLGEVTGFDDSSYYKEYEDNVLDVINSDSVTASLSSGQKALLAAVANSIIFGYSLNQSATLEDISYVIGACLQDSVSRIFGFAPYSLDRFDVVVHPFTVEVIQDLVALNSYTNVSSQIAAGSPKTKEIDLVHYNWYDTTRIFSNPNLDIMKSAENQYYYLSGSLTYPDIPEHLNFCLETGITITTATGDISFTYLRNQPCIDRNSYIGPVNHTKFYREFNDGPYSSGNFTDDVKTAFIDFDKEKLQPEEYKSNAAKFYNFTVDSSGNMVPLTAASVLYDINGEYNLTQEYSYAPMDTGCYAKYQVMRVGNSGIRSQCIEYNVDGSCITCVETGVTGFKFALLEVNPTGYSGDYAYILSNPYNSGHRIMKRALNYNENPYKGTISGDAVNTFELDINGNQIWYVGPPQISGNDILPFLAFTNEFENSVAGKTAKVVLYPAYGSANASKGSESDRTFTVSSRAVATGEDLTSYPIEDIYNNGIYPKAKFSQTIKPHVAGDDDAKLKFFGMGNYFSGLYNFVATNQENAGYFYTGYTDGNVSMESLVGNSLTIGSPTTGVRYIDGYTGVSNGESAPISRLYANDNSGNNLQYYFFDNRLVPAGVEVTNTSGWTTFAPLPTGLENNANYTRTYSSQINENAFQRYYQGPYSKINKKFLYPNATKVAIDFDAVNNGFPTKFQYKIEVREETVKEFFQKYTIQNGVIYDPEYIPVVRANPQGVVYDAMVDIFDCSGPDCDFNEREATGNFLYTLPLNNGVDNSWTSQPLVRTSSSVGVWGTDSDGTRNYIQAGKNTGTYVTNPTFKQGILLTGTTTIANATWDNLTPPIGATVSFSKSSSFVGLFHGYTGYEITGTLSYTRPAFNLSKGQIDRAFANESVALVSGGCTSYYYNDGFTSSPSLATGVANLYVKNLDGSTFYSDSGQDPIYQEYLGGRVGSGAENEGGYHTKQAIGDSWMGLNFRDFGYYCVNNGDGECSDLNRTGNWPVNATVNSNRIPEDDDHWFLIDINSSGAKIHTRALNYNPMSFGHINNSYTVDSSSPIVFLEGSESSMTFDESYNSFYIDLVNYMPLKSSTGLSEWYFGAGGSGDGVVVGPFDRDIEVFIPTGIEFSGQTDVYLNQRKITDLYYGSTGNCIAPKSILPFTGFTPFSVDTMRQSYINTYPVAYIPSGEVVVINIQNNFNPDVYNPEDGSYIGFEANSLIYIRARETLNESIYSVGSQNALGIIGSNFWLHNHNMANNGIERSYEIPIGPTELLNNTFSFISFSRTGKLYETPDIPIVIYDQEFVEIVGVNTFKTRHYPIVDQTVEEYLITKSSTQSDPIYFSGWREGSRISFKFTELTPIYGEMPYESHGIVTPSGNCILSGEMGYLSQADKSIFSEGVYLKDITENDGIKDQIYGPDYVSDTLLRVPFFNYPSGTFINPVLSAPSVMKQRKDRFNITRTQEYRGINTQSPQNYNKLLWPALSDLKTLNPDETIEEIPPDDGTIFTNSQILISASQGQRLPNGKNNPNTSKHYQVANQYQTYDSVATDALLNPTTFITSGFGFATELLQPTVGVICPKGSSLTDVILGLV